MRSGAVMATVLAGAAGLVIAASAVAAPNYARPSAYRYRTSCYSNDCVRFLCDEGGRDCFLIGYFDKREDIHPALPEWGDHPGPPPPEFHYYGYTGPHYHYKNVFDPDNDYDAYPY
jgi:hypothetical protein